MSLGERMRKAVVFGIGERKEVSDLSDLSFHPAARCSYCQPEIQFLYKMQRKARGQVGG